LYNLPPDLPVGAVKRIQAGLLRIHSERLEGLALHLCLRKAYDVCASTLKNFEKLDDTLLGERIPAMVLHWAFVNRWTTYPELRRAANGFVTSGVVTDQSMNLPVPEEERTVTVGESTITPDYYRELFQHFESRIAYWQGEALHPMSMNSPASSAPPLPFPLYHRMTARRLTDMLRGSETDAYQRKLAELSAGSSAGGFAEAPKSRVDSVENRRNPLEGGLAKENYYQDRASDSEALPKLNRAPKATNSPKRSSKYLAIDKLLQEIAKASPRSHKEVCRSLGDRKAPFPDAEPFRTARDWVAGFKNNPVRATQWLSKRWALLGLPPFRRGPE
jgi:hypothetical protein